MLFFIFLPCLYIFYRFFIARILSVLPENFRDWGGGAADPPAPPARKPMNVTKCQLMGDVRQREASGSTVLIFILLDRTFSCDQKIF